MWTSIWYSYVYLHETSKIIKRQTQIESKVGKEIIHSGFANHFSNEESVGGKLYLLVDKLQFQPHRLNLQNYELIITIEEIRFCLIY